MIGNWIQTIDGAECAVARHPSCVRGTQWKPTGTLVVLQIIVSGTCTSNNGDLLTIITFYNILRGTGKMRREHVLIKKGG